MVKCVLSASWQAGHTAAVQALVEGRADVNAQRDDGATAAVLAASKGRAGTVKMLADLGADMTAGRKDGITPALAAAAKGHKEVLDILAALGIQEEGAAVPVPEPVSASPSNNHVKQSSLFGTSSQTRQKGKKRGSLDSKACQVGASCQTTSQLHTEAEQTGKKSRREGSCETGISGDSCSGGQDL